jgi:succinate-acetate transporter protein
MSANKELGAVAIEKWTPGNPTPLGLAAFGVTTLFLSLVNANLISGNDTPAVLAVALFMGGLAQFAAGMWEFSTGNTFGAVVFSSYGAFWLTFFFLVQYQVGPIAKLGAVYADSAVGAYLWCWAVFTFLMLICTFAGPRAVTGVFVLLLATFILLGIGNSGGTSNIIHAGGYVGLATAAGALYVAVAIIMEDVYGRTVLPIGAPK